MLVVVGIIGNVLSAIAFLITKLKKISSCYYITALSVSDTIILIDAFLQWLAYIDINIYNQNYFCQVFAFVSRSAYFTSIWLVVAFTVERFIAVLHPLKRQTMCTARRACFVVSGLTLLSCTTRIPFIFIFAPVYEAHFDIFICGSNDVNQVRLLFFPLTIFVNVIRLKIIWKGCGAGGALITYHDLFLEVFFYYLASSFVTSL